MSDKIVVELHSQEQRLVQGPVPVLAMLTNVSPTTIHVLLPYPNPSNLGFRSLTQYFGAAKAVEQDPIERTAPIMIEPGKTHKATYYLNRYFSFPRAGNGEFEYRLRMRVTHDGVNPTSKTEMFGGTFGVQLIAGSENQLRGALALYSGQLRSLNRQEKMEAAEALAFVDTPLVVPYLLPMLQIDNLEVIGIHALARHPGSQSELAIKSMLGNPESAVVGTALEEIDRLKIGVTRKEVQQLLDSQNTNIQWLALGWLEARPSREDLPLLSRLLKSENSLVREKAKAYLGRLQ